MGEIEELKSMLASASSDIRGFINRYETLSFGCTFEVDV